VPKVDKATISCTGIVGGGALIVSVLSTEAPAACLPKGALLNPVTGCILIAPEAIWKDDLVSSTPLTKYHMVLQTVFSFLEFRWTLGSEDMWDLIITGWNKESGGERGTCGQKVLLEAGADCTRSEASFYCEQVSLSPSFLLPQF